MSINIKIFGSCVSRDILNYQSDKIDLVDYHARSSFGSAFSVASVSDVYTDKIESDFQRRMVAADLCKNFSQTLMQSKFDLILIDFIDERFNLFSFESGEICTLSNEFISTGFDPEQEQGRVIQSGSEEFFSLWEQGWNRFLSLVDLHKFRLKIRINKVFLATATASGQSFPTYNVKYIQDSNRFLERLYERVALDLKPWQFIDNNPAYFVGSDSHRWGLSPFHYIDAFYFDALRRILVSHKEVEKFNLFDTGTSDTSSKVKQSTSSSNCITDYPFDRSLISHKRFSSPQGGGDCLLSSLKLSGNCEVVHAETGMKLRFSGTGGTHQASFSLGEVVRANGIAAKIRLENWGNIRYLAFGYTFDGQFRHIKVVNPAQGQWITISLLHGDIAYGIQNNWEHPPPADVSDLRLYLRAEPLSGGATIEVENFVVWEELEHLPQAPTSCALPWVLPERKPVSPDLLQVLYGYLRKCFRHFDAQAEEFIKSGICPLYGETQREWSEDQPLPKELAAVGTYAFSWHSLHPASILMLYAKHHKQDAPVFAAREVVTNWLDRSYYKPDPDKKFAWYDHGVAERQMAFLLMWAEGVERGFDYRFMTRLGGGIVRHAELLETEQFYASHQPTRYHNHAWFQDIALMATALAIPDYPAASRWMQRSIERLSDQLGRLIVRDNGYAVFVENSIGYHQGVQRIVELAGDMVSLTGVESPIPDVAVELARFSEFFRYPDNRAPAQGDTFRRSNPEGKDVRRLKPYPEPEVVLLPKAGYGIVKGNHDNVRFMFTLFATSLCRTHKHEDDLSFTLFLDGLEWLIDPSFYSHEYKSPIPAYLRSAAAHNSIYIPDAAYTIDPGHSTLNGSLSADSFEFKGEHRCFAGALIKRTVKGSATELALEFEDEVTAVGEETFEPRLMLHCGEDVEVERLGNLLKLTHQDSAYILSLSMPSDQITIEKGLVGGECIRGVSGTAFMKSSEINTIECLIPVGVPLAWKILVEKKSDFSPSYELTVVDSIEDFDNKASDGIDENVSIKHLNTLDQISISQPTVFVKPLILRITGG